MPSPTSSDHNWSWPAHPQACSVPSDESPLFCHHPVTPGNTLSHLLCPPSRARCGCAPTCWCTPTRCGSATAAPSRSRSPTWCLTRSRTRGTPSRRQAGDAAGAAMHMAKQHSGQVCRGASPGSTTLCALWVWEEQLLACCLLLGAPGHRGSSCCDWRL